MRALSPSSACLVALLLCGCSTSPTTSEIRDMGPIRVVFLQQPGDVVALDSPYSGNAIFGCAFVAGIIAGLVCGGIEEWLDKFRRQAIQTEQTRLAVYADEIKTLGLNDRSYAMFNAVAQDTPWLEGKDVARVPWAQDGTAYARQVAGDTVVYIQPVFAMTRDSGEFLVYFFVAAQKFDPGYPNQIYDFQKQEFSFVHLPVRLQQSMDRRHRDAVENQAARMSPEKAMQLWFADDSALLRADFEQDLKQVDQDIRKMLGSRKAANSTRIAPITP